MNSPIVLLNEKRRTVASIVELALEEYAAKHSIESPAEAFYQQLRETWRGRES
ncbi:MAG: hypothetical protein U5L08_13040 [Xanthomonadales bacterium]|nr:hypothetical protein [Xanthomonadales bacterium]